MKRNKAARHFPYKHPTFGTSKRPSNPAAWEASVYYWWWAFLKRNERYLACCEAGGSGEYAEIYADLGDVRGDCFKTWWTEEGRGVGLFAEPRPEELVRVLTKGEAAPDGSNSLTVVLPLNLPKSYLLERCKELLADARKGGRGKLFARQSQARYQVKGQPNIPALRRALMTYDAVKKAKGQKPKKPYWRIATDLNLVASEDKVLPTDSTMVAESKRNVMKAIVGRLKRRAEIYIEQSAGTTFIGG
jgi:hypothetical protein